MAKDPAALFFIDKWFLATKEMKADCRGWYLNLILHQFDKKDLPNDIEELANLADVRISEFETFKQVFKQVLVHKFKQNENGRLENDFATEIIRNREEFKEKRSDAGKISYFVKFIRDKLCKDENVIFFIKSKVNTADIDTKNQTKLEHLFKHLYQLYINVNVNTSINVFSFSYEGFKGNFSFDLTELDFMLIQSMMKIWMQEFPDYHFEVEKDFPACLKIAYKIADGKSWVRATVVNGNMDECLSEWKSLVNFISKDNFYSSFNVERISNNFQGIKSKQNAKRNNTRTVGKGSATVGTFTVDSSKPEEPL